MSRSERTKKLGELSPEARRRLVQALARLVLEEEAQAAELRRLRELR